MSYPHVPLVLEYLADNFANQLQAQAGDPQSPLLAAYTAFISLLGPDAEDRVRMVITADMAQSVFDREGARDGLAPFTIERGAGLVAAKNMPAADGSVDVLFQAFLVAQLEGRSSEETQITAGYAQHTALHEAVHARQNLAHERPYNVHERRQLGVATAQYAAMAATQVGEHIAEFFANSGSPHSFDAASLQASFASWRAAVEEGLPAIDDDDPDYFFKGLEVSVNAIQNVWNNLAYLAAELRHGDGFAVPSPDLTALPDWVAHVAPWWDEYVALLGAVPMQIEPEIVATDSIVLELAALLQRWFHALGFDYHDSGDNAYFRVMLWD